MVSRRLLGLLAALAVPVRALTGSKPKYQHEHRHEHARRPVNTSGRPVGSSASSFLQTDADADSAAMVSMTTLSKEEWHAQHKAMYETEFTIEFRGPPAPPRSRGLTELCAKRALLIV
ncbi:unnamed protein product [Prorocentrum cordatum]|uniref:Uncharacterized protein n=1 Tax=Prorocentrum cordatum TaxID=2364126 RepID=A0ABN9UCR5_9DINO|nr:unnamed protein product [Polarella glacialis]